MMRIFLADLERQTRSMRWLEYFKPPSLLPLYGCSLYDLLKKEFKTVSYLTDSNVKWRIWSKRFNLPLYDSFNGESIILNQKILAPPLQLLRFLKHILENASAETVYKIGDHIVAFYAPNGFDLNLFRELGDVETVSLDLPWLKVFSESWELLTSFLSFNYRDVLHYTAEFYELDEYDENIYVARNVEINDKYTAFDASQGPIVILNDVVFEGFNFIKGPVFIGERSFLLGAKIYSSIIGPVSKIGSEVGESIIFGFSNAAHHGYVGHSLVGHWVNIGAGTVFSDLKNTYGNVRIRFMSQEIDTGLIKLGSIVGDHVKISINTSIYGGRLIGLFSHISGLVRKNIPPFTMYDGWKDEEDKLMLDKVIEIVGRVYKRRDVELLEEEFDLLNELYHYFEN